MLTGAVCRQSHRQGSECHSTAVAAMLVCQGQVLEQQAMGSHPAISRTRHHRWLGACRDTMLTRVVGHVHCEVLHLEMGRVAAGGLEAEAQVLRDLLWGVLFAALHAGQQSLIACITCWGPTRTAELQGLHLMPCCAPARTAQASQPHAQQGRQHAPHP